MSHLSSFPAQPLPLRVLMLLVPALLAACGNSDDPGADTFTITRNGYGVPHIQAASIESAATGMGLAQAEDHFCQIQEHAVTVNGERALRLGAEGRLLVESAARTVSNVDADFFYRLVIDRDKARASFDAADSTTRALLRGYLAGYNLYFQRTPKQDLDSNCAAYARELTPADLAGMLVDRLVRAGSGAFFTALATPPQPPAPATVARQRALRLPTAAVLAHLPQAPSASNGWAFGRDVASGGRGVLFGNPHFPLAGLDRFVEARVTVPGEIDVSGITQLGLPAVAIGYNRDVAWSHTVSSARRFTLHELALKPGDPLTYTVDGAERAITPVDITVPLPALAGQPSAVTRRYYRTEFGPLLQLAAGGLPWSAKFAYALQDVNLDNNRAVNAWWQMGRARNVRALRDTLADTRALPWVNTLAADGTGEVLFADLSPVPRVEAADIQRCAPSPQAAALLGLAQLVVLKATDSSCNWARAAQPMERLLPAERMPALIRTDYVANSNDSYWLAHPQHSFAADLSPILGPVGVPQRLRTRAALDLIEQRLAGTDGLPGQKVSATALMTLWARNQNMAARLVLDDLLAQVCGTPEPTATLPGGTPVPLVPACNTLARWDRSSSTQARGAHLFREFWSRAAKLPGVFAVPFNPAQPQVTPRGLAVAATPALTVALGQAVVALQAQGVALDATLGSVQALTGAGVRRPIPGGDEFEGVLNKMQPRPLLGGQYEPYNGTTWLQIVTLGDEGAQAEGFLGYSQSTAPRSPHAADQLPLLSSQITRPLPALR